MLQQSDPQPSKVDFFSGLEIDLMAPNAKQVRIDDVAYSLSKQCRFNGNVDDFYSVAQHSVLCSRLVDADAALPCLLHDAHEMINGDVTRPVKAYLRKFTAALDELEAQLAAVCYQALVPSGHPWWDRTARVHILGQIEHADRVALSTEKRDLKADSPDWGYRLPDPLSVKIEPLNHDQAYQLFMGRYTELMRPWR